MSRLHICNTFFERELEGAKKSLSQWMRSHPIVMQLQFLPLLYAGPNDRILVSDLPDNPDPRLCLIDNPPKGLSIEHWGPSLAIADWAKTHNIPYNMPDWETVRTLNSKIFSFTHSPKLPGAEILENPAQAEAWIKKTSGPKVLKTPFGTAGTGHIPVDENLNVKRQYKTPQNEAFCGDPKKLDVKRLYIWPLIGEPWVERVMDFSTQWRDGELLGVTVFENEPNGTYKGTYAAEVESWALEEHLAIAKPLMKKMYPGNVGVDAYIYLWQGKKRVQPIVEINGRKTMSWVALQTPQKRLYYTRAASGLLPSHLKSTKFPRNITYT